MEENNPKTGTYVRVLNELGKQEKIFPRSYAMITDIHESANSNLMRCRVSSCDYTNTYLFNSNELEPVNFVLNKDLAHRLGKGEIVLSVASLKNNNYIFARNLIAELHKYLREERYTINPNEDGRYYFYSKFYSQLEYSYDAGGIPKKMRDLPRVDIFDFFTDELKQVERSNYSIF